MLTITQVHYIRKLFYDKGKTLTEIEKATGHNYRTIRKYIEQEDFNETPKRNHRSNNSDYLRPYIRECLEAYKTLKAKHQLHKAESIYRYLKDEKGLKITIGKRRFRTLVAEEKQELNRDRDVYLDLTHPGGEAQLDFGEVFVEEQGAMVKKHELVLSFPYSNAGYVQITESEQSEALFEAMERIFQYIGKVPNKIWFDQMSTAALRGKDANGFPRISKRLARFSTHYGFESIFCNPHSGHEKGSVENKIGYYRRNFINTRRALGDLKEANLDLLKACDADHLRSHYQRCQPIETLFEKEKLKMKPMNPIPLDMSRLETRRVDKYAHVSFEGNHYSVHPSFVQMSVTLKITAKTIEILNDDYDTLASHRRSYHKGRTFTHWKDFLDPLSKRPRAIKYSGIYQLLPKIWQDYLNRLSKAETKEALAFLKHCLIHHEIKQAETVLSTNLAKSIESPKALWTTLHRLSEDKAVYEGISLSADIPTMASYKPDFSTYDTLIRGLHDER